MNRSSISHKFCHHRWQEKRSIINVEAQTLQFIEQKDVLSSKIDRSFIFAENLIAEEWHSDVENQKWIKSGRKLLKKAYFKKILQEGKELKQEFNFFLSQLKPSLLEEIKDDELIRMFIKSCHYHSRFKAYFKNSRQEFLYHAEKKLKNLLKTKVNHDKINKVFEILTTPHQLDDINRELIDWFRLLNKKELRPILIIDHLAKYSWLVAHSWNYNQIIKEYINKYKRDLKKINVFRKQIKKMKNNKKFLLSEQKRLMDKIKNLQIKYLSWLFQKSSLERMKLKGSWAGSDFLYYFLYKEISRRTGIKLGDIYTYYRIDEVIKGIKLKRPIISDLEQKKRMSAYIFQLEGNKLFFSSGKKAKVVIKKEFDYFNKFDTKDLKGQIASLGFSEGRIKIIIPGNIDMLNKNFKKFKKGEILVTTMTQPNMLPIIRRAKAVITDEGGLTSHAAIISREFKIPCIVGTEVATKVLKDGDRVEVDANKGIVKKL